MENNYFYFINRFTTAIIADLDFIKKSERTIDININSIATDINMCDIIGAACLIGNYDVTYTDIERIHFFHQYLSAFDDDKTSSKKMLEKMKTNPTVRILITNNETLEKLKKHISTKCRKCGGLAKESTAFLNIKEWDENNNDRYKTQSIKCLKCSSCGHSWTKNKELEIVYNLYIVSDHTLAEKKFIDKFKSMENAAKKAKELSGSWVWDFKRKRRRKWVSPSFIDLGGHYMIEKVSNYV
jgi:hypothetical protein